MHKAYERQMQSMKWLTEYFAERAMNVSALKS